VFYKEDVHKLTNYTVANEGKVQIIIGKIRKETGIST
jgi:hypothetical protein